MKSFLFCLLFVSSIQVLASGEGKSFDWDNEDGTITRFILVSDKGEQNSFEMQTCRNDNCSPFTYSGRSVISAEKICNVLLLEDDMKKTKSSIKAAAAKPLTQAEKLAAMKAKMDAELDSVNGKDSDELKDLKKRI